MNILYYDWGENSSTDMIQTFQQLGHNVTRIRMPLKDYFHDDTLETTFLSQLSHTHYEFIFTFNFFPVISNIAQQKNIPYISWVYDCPHFTLYSKALTNACNYIFLFDQKLTELAITHGAAHAFHLPLAANFGRLEKMLHLPAGYSFADFKPDCYDDEISFVGNLYENNLFQQIQYLPDSLRGFLDGMMQAQKQLWGMDLISELMTPKLTEQLNIYLKLDPNPDFTYTPTDIFCDMLQTKITSDERISALNLLSQEFPVSLYTNSDHTLCPKTIAKGYISYLTDMPKVFRQSKINLNISLRSITSGIPLRAIDIFASGGFLLSNYQPELCEYFSPGIDFVYFEDFNDMAKKADYYLTHEEERNQIAYNGWKKASELFSYKKQTGILLKTVFP